MGGNLHANYGRVHYNQKYPFSVNWHVFKLPEWECRIPQRLNAHAIQDGAGILSALNTFFAKYELHQKLTEYHTLFAQAKDGSGGGQHLDLGNEMLTAEDFISDPISKALHDIPSSDLSDAQMLRWMVTLVVDLHYPFNLGFKTTPEVTHTKAHIGMDPPIPLSTFFEKLQSEVIVHDINVGQHHIKKEGETDLDQEDISIKHPFELFHRWGEETAEIACSIYRDLGASVGSAGFPPDFTVSPEMKKKWIRLLEMRMEVAAKNVVILLRNIATHRAHTEAENAGRGRHHPRKGWKKDAFKNLMVAAFVIPAFFLLMKYFEQSRFDMNRRKL